MRRSFLLLADAPISASANCSPCEGNQARMPAAGRGAGEAWSSLWVIYSRQRHRPTREITASTLLATCKEG